MTITAWLTRVHLTTTGNSHNGTFSFCNCICKLIETILATKFYNNNCTVFRIWQGAILDYKIGSTRFKIFTKSVRSEIKRNSLKSVKAKSPWEIESHNWILKSAHCCDIWLKIINIQKLSTSLFCVRTFRLLIQMPNHHTRIKY